MYGYNATMRGWPSWFFSCIALKKKNWNAVVEQHTQGALWCHFLLRMRWLCSFCTEQHLFFFPNPKTLSIADGVCNASSYSEPIFICTHLICTLMCNLSIACWEFWALTIPKFSQTCKYFYFPSGCWYDFHFQFYLTMACFVRSKAEQRNSSVWVLNIILQPSSYIGAHIFMHYFNVLNYFVADYDCVKCCILFLGWVTVLQCQQYV